MGKIKLSKIKDRVAFRKMAVASWDSVADPSVYSFIEIDMTNAQNYMKNYSEAHGVKVTPTHLVGHVIAKVIEKRPEINAILRGSTIYQRENVGIFFLVNKPCEESNDTGRADLSGCTVHGAEEIPLYELCERINSKVHRVRTDSDREISSTIKLLNHLPWSFSKSALKLVSFLNYGLNLDLEWAGIPKDPFGSVMITNVGSLGIDNALAPLTPHSRSPLFLTLGKINEKPIAVNGEVEIRPVMTLGVTFDHRFMDGSHGAEMVALFKNYMENPDNYLEKIKPKRKSTPRNARSKVRLNAV